MDCRDIYLSNNIEAIRKAEINSDISEMKRYNFELDFVEQYEDVDGILHVKTFFSHDEIDQSDLWEVFVPEEGSKSLELLLSDDI